MPTAQVQVQEPTGSDGLVLNFKPISYANIDYNYKMAQSYVDLILNGQRGAIQRYLSDNSKIIPNLIQALHLFSLALMLRPCVLFREKCTDGKTEAAETSRNSMSYICCDCHAHLFTLKIANGNIERVVESDTFNHRCRPGPLNILKSSFLSLHKKVQTSSDSEPSIENAPATTAPTNKIPIPFTRKLKSGTQTLKLPFQQPTFLYYELLNPELNQAIPHSYISLVRFIYITIKINHKRIKLDSKVDLDLLTDIITNIILAVRFKLNKTNLQGFCNPLALTPQKVFDEFVNGTEGRLFETSLYQEIYGKILKERFKKSEIANLKESETLIEKTLKRSNLENSAWNGMKRAQVNHV
ncbi:hypothetical protein WICPIJ_009810 [Wickerhamomyces pijperi]|uniref:Uncharacterized protein n=1 Tax=Wickerhamomyces pijperi TaxID=599730 RepID=A0A9P8PL76_WICPI|nr:hypothetical protein WICPIJ_009810 [Wickerhamomyces pijperi]